MTNKIILYDNRSKLFVIAIMLISLSFFYFYESFLSVLNHILVFYIFSYCIYRGFKERNLFNPYFFFAITPLSLLLYNANLSEYYFLELSQFTWTLSILSMLLFVIGLNSAKRKIKSEKTIISRSKMMNHSILFLILSIIPALYGIIFGFAHFISFDLIGLKPYMVLFPFSAIFYLFKYPAIVFAIKSKSKFHIATILLISSIFTFLNFNKTDILFLLIVPIIAFSKFSIKLQKRKLLIIVLMIVMIGIIIWAFSFYEGIRGQFNTIDLILNNNRVNWNYNDNLLLPYMYLTTPWSNLQYVIDTQISHTFGLWTLKPLMGYFQLDNLLSEYYTLKSFTSFNTFTFITVQFKDFGLIGSGILSFILGLIVKRVYYNHKFSDSPIYTTSFAVFSVPVLEMFFSNHFFMISYPFTILIIMYLYKKALKYKII